MGLWDRLIGGLADVVADRVAGTLENSQLIKSAPEGPGIPQDSPKGMQAMLYDPFALIETLGYRERHSALTYDTLLRMGYQLPVFPGIVQTRIAQIKTFMVRMNDEALPGWYIGLRNRTATPSKKDEKRLQAMEELVENCGTSESLTKDSLSTFAEKFVRDSLFLDQACFEIEENRKGVPCNFYAVDGGSIRLADVNWKDWFNDDTVRYVQVADGSVIAEFTPKQLCFGVRNPRTDLRVNGYGFSELEMGLTAVTSLINGLTYNAKFFSQGTVATGMLNLPKVPDAKLRIFARQWHQIVSGVLNAWRTPITNFEDAKWIDLKKNNRDMEWAEFINFLIKVFCAVCLIDPQEIHFQYGNVGQSSQLFGAPAEEKIKASKDKGLRPLLEFVATCLNRYFIQRIDPGLELRFTGLDPREGEKTVDIEKKQVTYLKTVNELRAENDLKKLDADLGDVLLDPNWVQIYNNKKAMEQQQQGMGEDQDGGNWDDFGLDMPEDDQGEEQEAPVEKSTAENLRKARVTERRRGDVVTYDIDL